jgi:hypothetical protein
MSWPHVRFLLVEEQAGAAPLHRALIGSADGMGQDLPGTGKTVTPSVLGTEETAFDSRVPDSWVDSSREQSPASWAGDAGSNPVRSTGL